LVCCIQTRQLADQGGGIPCGWADVRKSFHPVFC
jgi:hypothetical protein